jgi:hypothetical protein
VPGSIPGGSEPDIITSEALIVTLEREMNAATRQE